MRLFSGLRVLSLAAFLASTALLFTSAVRCVPLVATDAELYLSGQPLSLAFCVRAVSQEMVMHALR